MLKKCLEKEIAIPAEIVRIDGEDGTVKILHKTQASVMEKEIPVPVQIAEPDDGNNGEDKVLHTCQTTQASAVESEKDHNNCPRLLENMLKDMQPVDEEIISIIEKPLQPEEEGISIVQNPLLLDEQIEATLYQSDKDNISVTQPHNIPLKQTTANIYPLVTCMAKSAAVVPEVQQVDRKRVLLNKILKSDPKSTSYNKKNQSAINEYEDSLTPIKSKVLAQHSEVKRQFAEWEKSYYMKNNQKAPTYEEIKNDPEASYC